MSKIRTEIFNKNNGACVMCSRELSLEYDFETNGDNYIQVEHLIPKSIGGGNNIENLFPSCRRCNAYKGNTLVDTKISNIFKFNTNILSKIRNESKYEITNNAISKDSVTKAIDLVIDDMEEAIKLMRKLRGGIT